MRGAQAGLPILSAASDSRCPSRLPHLLSVVPRGPAPLYIAPIRFSYAGVSMRTLPTPRCSTCPRTIVQLKMGLFFHAFPFPGVHRCRPQTTPCRVSCLAINQREQGANLACAPIGLPLGGIAMMQNRPYRSAGAWDASKVGPSLPSCFGERRRDGLPIQRSMKLPLYVTQCNHTAGTNIPQSLTVCKRPG
jgi:hypothetical protein